MEKQYEAKRIEREIYARWLRDGSFTADVQDNKPSFSVVMPPPNITGQLHMGHALDNTLQDILVRFKRMAGYSVLWVPGTDHASIATEVKIVDRLKKEGLTKQDIGREAFLKRAWAWKEEFGGKIEEQLKKLGISCDWTRERFTLDEGCSKAVVEAFVRLYEKGLIYKGDRIINWCPCCRTALSDAEVEYEESHGYFWHIRYPLADGSGEIIVATTRPETMLGDTAVAVHPEDERYRNMVGKEIRLPLVGRLIPIVADDYVDMDFGTGAVKITPAHDPNDFQVGVRHQLPVVRVMDDGGVINEQGGKYEGLDRYEARKAIVADLEAQGLLFQIEEHEHNVGTCYRCHTVVEPIVSKQWFISMEQLAKPALEAVRSGKTQFVPDRFSKIYYNWMENIQDWCISRQLWWGHRIPADLCEKCGHIVVGRERLTECPKCGGHMHQEEDVLDTWFSSGLWPFSTLGWPEETEELKKYYPNSVLVTAYDIIFFWVARMITFGTEMMHEAPFAHVIIHGLIRDSQGRKMSKSLGNGVDPLEVVEQYGADALRFSLARGISPGNDSRYYDERVEHCRNFANKIWNASRFVLMNEEGLSPKLDESRLDWADKWLLEGLNQLIADETRCLDQFEFGLCADKLYDFIWGSFCDWYIELVKPRLYGDDQAEKEHVLGVLLYALERLLKLLHPFMPFITEEIYQQLPEHQPTLMKTEWPAVDGRKYAKEAARMEQVMDVIVEVRRIRAEMNVAPSKKATLYVIAGPDKLQELRDMEIYLKRLAYSEKVNYQEDKTGVPQNAVPAVCPAAEIYLPLTELVDLKAELKRLQEEEKRLQGEIKRGEGKLSNQGFIAKAPKALVEEETQKLKNYREMHEKVTAQISAYQEMQ